MRDLSSDIPCLKTDIGPAKCKGARMDVFLNSGKPILEAHVWLVNREEPACRFEVMDKDSDSDEVEKAR